MFNPLMKKEEIAPGVFLTLWRFPVTRMMDIGNLLFIVTAVVVLRWMAG